MNVERLTRMEALLRAPLPENTDFNIDTWIEKHWHLAEGTTLEEIPCGTVCCAVGLACRDPWFNEQGLRFSHGEPDFEEHSGFRAVARFFEITAPQATELFSGDYYPRQVDHYGDRVLDKNGDWISAATPELVANRIRALLDSTPAYGTEAP
jgi:hypothetical protein